jgi:hypothetical protein
MAEEGEKLADLRIDALAALSEAGIEPKPSANIADGAMTTLTDAVVQCAHDTTKAVLGTPYDGIPKHAATGDVFDAQTTNIQNKANLEATMGLVKHALNLGSTKYASTECSELDNLLPNFTTPQLNKPNQR